MNRIRTVEQNSGRSAKSQYIFTSESVTEGHPDKVCDYISDCILDSYLAEDKFSHIACETLCKGSLVILAGEISSKARLNHEAIVREAIREIGYTDNNQPFSSEAANIVLSVSPQALEISQAVSNADRRDQGAGDQGIMFGYATNETPELMPLPILLAHRLSRGLAEDRKSGRVPWLRPDGKTQVSVSYENDRPVSVSAVLVSTQHASGTDLQVIRNYVESDLAPRVLKQWNNPGIEYIINPSGSFEIGGPAADCGLTGRKIIVDTYGGAARHGGGCFSGKDPSKVDRSAAYFCRFVARLLVLNGVAEKAELQVSYAIGRSKPVSVKVDTFGTGDVRAAEEYVGSFDFRPAAIIESLDLLRPIYQSTSNYGHFGKPDLPWEQ